MPCKPRLEITAEKIELPAAIRELWAFRDLLICFVWTEITTKYRQTILGAVWAIIQPLATMLMLTVIFHKFLHAPTDGLPFAAFSYSALLCWQYFSSALTKSSQSVLTNAGILKKIYFPRIALPISSVVPQLVDFAIALTVLGFVMCFYGIGINSRIVFLPFCVMLLMLPALGAGLWLSALQVRFRDVYHLLPLIIQLWFFACPIGYALSAVPREYQGLYELNPLVGAIECFRWCLLGTQANILQPVVLSSVVSLIVLISGAIFFQSAEGGFADFT